MIARRMTDGRRPGRTALAGVAVAATALALAGGQAAALARPGRAGQAGLAALAPGAISTLAGGVGGPAPATVIPFDSPYSCGTVQYSAGRLYVSDQNGSVRSVSVRTDFLTTPAGVGLDGYSGDGGPAIAAQLGLPCAATIDGAGNLVIADKGNGRIRVVAARTGTFYGHAMTAGDIYTVVRGGADCKVRDGSGKFCPVDVVTDNHGNVLVSDEGTEDPRVPSEPLIWVVAPRSGTFYGKALKAGKAYRLGAGGGRQLAVDPAGNIVVADGAKVTVLAERTGRFYGQAMTLGKTYLIAGAGVPGSGGDGGPARKAKLNDAAGVAVDRSGNVVIADNNANQVRVVAVSTGRFYGKSLRAGDIYLIAGHRSGLTGNGVPAIQATVFAPHSVTVDGRGNVVLTDESGTRARVIATAAGQYFGMRMKAGDIYTVAGSKNNAPYLAEGGPATSAQIGTDGVATDPSGNVLLAGGLLRVVAAKTATSYGKPMTAGHIYTIAGGGSAGLGDGGLATKARLSAADVAVDGAGNLVVSDPGSHRVRVVAALTGTFYGQAMTAGHIYTVAGDGSAGSAGDGGPATAAELSSPAGVAVDPAGNVAIVDAGSSLVRVVAAATGTFYGQAMTGGDIYTVAGSGACDYSGDGGPATAAAFCFIDDSGVAVDQAGNLVIADSENSRVRVVAGHSGTFYGQVMTVGDAYTVIGDGATGSAGNGGPATSAELHYPAGVAVDGAGNLVVADSASGQVRLVAASTGTFYDVPVVAGDIYAVAGTGRYGLAGDDGTALAAVLNDPGWVSADPSGNLVMGDGGRVRIVWG